MEKINSNNYIKLFYCSEFILSSALGMIPLMTVLSFLMSSMSDSTISYALILALYNICTTLPKIYVANNLSNKSSTFSSLFILRSIQVILWACISFVFMVSDGSQKYLVIFCSLYLIYAMVKGSIDVLNIDIYSKVIPRDTIGKFFGLKHSLNSLAEFIGALFLASIFKALNINVNYAIIFLVVGVLDFISLMTLCFARKSINVILSERQITEQKNKGKDINYEKEISSDLASRYKSSNFYKNLIKTRNVVSNDKVFRSFLKANVISIIGASVASFFIPYGTAKLNLTIETITFTNALWLICKMFSSIIWGHVADKFGTKYVMVGSRVCLLTSYMIAIGLNSVNMFYLMILLHGFSSSALVIMAQNIFIEISGDKGALYAAVNSFICMPFFVIMPLVTSCLSETVGYVYSFIISSIPLFISILLMFRVKIEKGKSEAKVS